MGRFGVAVTRLDPTVRAKSLRKNNLVELALRFAPDLAAND